MVRKKITFLLSVLVLVGLLVSACAPKATPTPTPKPEPTPTKKAEVAAPTPAPAPEGKLPPEDQFYYFLAANIVDPFYVPGVAGMKAAAEWLGVKGAEMVGPADLNVADQLKTWDDLLVKPGTAGILVYAVDFKAAEPYVDKTHEAGQSVVWMAADADFKTRDSFVGYDMARFGSIAADFAAAAIGGKGKVGTVGIMSSMSVAGKVEGFKERLAAAYPDIEFVEAASQDGSVDGATKALDAYMTAHPDLDLLWWADGMSGSMAGLMEEYTEGGGKTLWMATDMPPHTLAAVKEGTFIATMGQDTFTEEFTSMIMAYLTYNGFRVPGSCFLKPIIITADNVDQFLASPDTSPVVRKAPPPEDQFYYFLAANIVDPFYVPGVAGMKAAAEWLGVKGAEMVGPADLNVADQLKTWDDLLVKPGTAGILVYAVDFKAAEPYVDKTHEAGQSVVWMAADADFKTRDSFVGYDMARFGSIAADFAAAAIGGKGKVGTVGIMSSMSVAGKVEGFKERLAAAYPDIEFVEAASQDGSVDGATKALDAYMTAHPDLDLLWWADGMSGSMAGLMEEYTEGGGKTLWMATDMPPHTLAAVKEGTFIATMGQDTFTEEFTSMIMAHLAYQGYRVPDSCFLKPIIITADNVGQFLEE